MAEPLTRGLHHLGLTVSDLAAARAFFMDALNFKLVAEDPAYPAAFVTDGITMITLWAAEEGAAPFDRRRQVGLHHAAFMISCKLGPVWKLRVTFRHRVQGRRRVISCCGCPVDRASSSLCLRQAHNSSLPC
jgi:catechol 2,3-dioxygenase-like lactoylglutathione lyase family enzyme